MSEERTMSDEPEFDMHISDVSRFEVAFANEHDQMASFMNSTIQNSLDGKWTVSIATFVDLPEGLTSQEEVAAYVRATLTTLIAGTEGVIFDVQVGPSMEYLDIIEEEARDHEPDEEDL